MSGPQATRRAVVVALLVVTLGGCGKHYWVKTGTQPDDFNRDSTACTAEATPTPGAARYGIVVEDVYRACMRARGWARRQSHEPVPPGYYRGPHE
jgi:hypothetical protein